LYLFDVSDPLRPRLAMRPSPRQEVLRLVPHSIISFTKSGDILANTDSYTLAFVRIPFKGLDVEDDAIGRFARCRLDGGQTLRHISADFDWSGSAAAGPAPDAHRAGGKGLARSLVIAKVPPLRVDGDWSAWSTAGVVPQIVSLPIPGSPRNWPDGLWQTFREGTAIGAVAHDGKNLYAYFLVADDTMHFDAEDPGRMWEFDSVEL
jgi:hypothetical protein